jgi:hypothetical protein
LLSQHGLAEKLGFRAEILRDVEALALLSKKELTATETQELNRALLLNAFPFELTQHARDKARMSAYVTPSVQPPPPGGSTITLVVNIPRAGKSARLPVVFENGEEALFEGSEPVELKNIPNAGGRLRFRIPGDDTGFPRSLTWKATDVANNGRLELPIDLFGGDSERLR